ncbi:MAG: MFS transporter, partial [Chloroflexota bacterium]
MRLASPRRPGVILALVCVPIFIGALDLTIVSAVLPAVLTDLQVPVQTGLDDAVWVVSGYLLAYTASMTFMGRASDLWGRRRIYIVCLAIFIIGSALVAAAPDAPADLAYRIGQTLTGSRPDRSYMALYALIFGRVVQAFGAGALVPVSMALVGDLYPPERRAAPLGIIGGVDTAGWVLGHVYGGIMVQYFSWPVLFWINLPLAGAALALTAWALKDVPQPRSTGRFDWLGAGLITLTLIGLNLALNAGAEASPGLTLSQLQEQPAFSLPLLLATVMALGAFGLVQYRSSSPLLNLTMFRDRNVYVASLANLLIGFCLMAGLVSVPLYMNTVPTVLYGLDQEQAALLAGYLLAALTVPMALASVVGGRLSDRLGYL